MYFLRDCSVCGISVPLLYTPLLPTSTLGSTVFSKFFGSSSFVLYRPHSTHYSHEAVQWVSYIQSCSANHDNQSQNVLIVLKEKLFLLAATCCFPSFHPRAAFNRERASRSHVSKSHPVSSARAVDTFPSPGKLFFIQIPCNDFGPCEAQLLFYKGLLVHLNFFFFNFNIGIGPTIWGIKWGARIVFCLSQVSHFPQPETCKGREMNKEDMLSVMEAHAGRIGWRSGDRSIMGLSLTQTELWLGEMVQWATVLPIQAQRPQFNPQKSREGGWRTSILQN